MTAKSQETDYDDNHVETKSFEITLHYKLDWDYKKNRKTGSYFYSKWSHFFWIPYFSYWSVWAVTCCSRYN